LNCILRPALACFLLPAVACFLLALALWPGRFEGAAVVSL
jgi:hypothetical protein